ncbi:hypothetical protein [Scytonema sp. NUACC26]|uniref:hypothetical protein n=1 Tax=Scytonema sp. NUACC26 TaxID=3140176 RepID=UPI0038B2C6FC
MSDFLFWIESKGEWMTFEDAWNGKHILSDNYHRWFDEPTKPEDIERGYFL